MWTGVNISPTCIAELEAFKIDRATNINKDVPLGVLLPCKSLLGRALHMCRSASRRQSLPCRPPCRLPPITVLCLPQRGLAFGMRSDYAGSTARTKARCCHASGTLMWLHCLSKATLLTTDVNTCLLGGVSFLSFALQEV